MLFDEHAQAAASTGSPREPEDLETLVEAVTLYHMVIEGMLALTGQHFIIDYNEQQGTLPGFVEGFNNVARDEHRHVAFGARFLRDMAREDPRYRDAIQRTLVEVRAGRRRRADSRTWAPEDESVELFGTSSTRRAPFAMKALERRLKVIGLVAARLSGRRGGAHGATRGRRRVDAVAGRRRVVRRLGGRRRSTAADGTPAVDAAPAATGGVVGGGGGVVVAGRVAVGAWPRRAAGVVGRASAASSGGRLRRRQRDGAPSSLLRDRRSGPAAAAGRHRGGRRSPAGRRPARRRRPARASA